MVTPFWESRYSTLGRLPYFALIRFRGKRLTRNASVFIALGWLYCRLVPGTVLTRKFFRIRVIKIGAKLKYTPRAFFLWHCHIERDNVIFSNIYVVVWRDTEENTSVKRRSSSPLWNPGTHSNYQALLLLSRWLLRECVVIKRAKVYMGANIADVRFYVITCTSRETD